MTRLTKVFIAAIFLLSISACDRKNCTKVVCPSYETCYQGQCLCPDGYQGTDCQTLSSTQYTGNWIVNENCGTNIPPNTTGYYVYIAPTGSPANYLTVSNLLNLGTSFTAELYNTTPGNEGANIYIPAQSQGGVSIANSYGTYSTATGAAVITLVLNYSYSGINYSCQETFYKQ